MTKAIKEIIIMLLVCLVTMLILAISLYRYVPSKKAVPEITTYVATEEVQDLLMDNIDTKEKEEVVSTYEVTAGDLKGYQNVNSYVPGKSNPFAPASETINPDENNQSNDNTPNSDTDKNQTTEKNETKPGNTPNVYNQNTGTK